MKWYGMCSTDGQQYRQPNQLTHTLTTPATTTPTISLRINNIQIVTLKKVEKTHSNAHTGIVEPGEHRVQETIKGEGD